VLAAVISGALTGPVGRAVAAPARSASAPGPATADAGRRAPVARLHALYDAQRERDLQDHPLFATYRGDRRCGERWPAFTRAAIDRTNAANARVLEALATLPRDALPPAEQLNRDLFPKEYEHRVTVARIRAEMQKVTDEVGFEGTRQEFFAKLRSDPQLYYATPDQLFRAYVVAAKLIAPELPKLFGKLYRAPFGVRPIPATSAPNTTTAYCQPPGAAGRVAIRGRRGRPPDAHNLLIHRELYRAPAAPRRAGRIGVPLARDRPCRCPSAATPSPSASATSPSVAARRSSCSR
jgi:hypothetical protein